MCAFIIIYQHLRGTIITNASSWRTMWRLFYIASGIGINGPLTRCVKLRVVHAPETFSLPLTLKETVSDPGMHHGTCVAHVPWCMSGSLIRGGGENIPGIPGTCATCNFTYLARIPWYNPNFARNIAFSASQECARSPSYTVSLGLARLTSTLIEDITTAGLSTNAG